MRSLENQGVAYHDQLAGKWSEFYSSRGFQKRKEVFDEVLKKYVETGQRWLDAGCGSGVLSLSLANLGANVLGIDASVPMLKSAEHNVSASSAAGQISFQHVCTVEDLKEVEGDFDGIVCSSVVEYVSSPESVLAEFRRKLRPGGILLISVPNKYSFVRAGQKILRKCGNIFRINISSYLDVSLNDYSKSEFRAQLEQHGYDHLNCIEFDPVLPVRLSGVPRSLLIFIAKRRVS